MTLGPNLWIEFGVAVICFFYFYSKHAIKVTQRTLIASALFLLSSMYIVHGGSIPGYISKAMLVSLAVVLLNVKVDWRVDLWQHISKWYSVLVALSILTWLLHLVIPLPHVTTVADMNDVPIHFHNYFFFRETMFNEYFLDYRMRFQGMFLEPGHMGTITAFFLISNRFNFKNKGNIVFLFGALLTLSASAYLLVALGYMSYMITEGKGSKGFWAILGLAIVVLFFLVYNHGDNVINELIFGKLTREEGALESRVSLEVLMLFENMWSTGVDLWFGKGAFLELETPGSGFYLFFVYCGIVGTVLLLLAYYSIYFCCRSKYGFFMFLLYLVSFLQRTYPYWDAFSLPFILGLPFILRETSMKRV